MNKQKYSNKNCEICEVEFTPKRKGQRYCKSYHPVSQVPNKKQLPNKKCELCEVEFTPRVKSQRYCQNPHPMSCFKCKKDYLIKPSVGRIQYSCGDKECSRELRKKTVMERYGVENPSQSKEFQEKMKQTILKKYGVEYVGQSKEVHEKAKQTNLKKYGVEYASQLKEVKEKIKKTNLKKYGVECSLQSKEVHEKAKQTILKKYGVEYAIQSKEVQEKVKQTNLKKYGVEYASQLKEVQEKKKQTNLKKYGVENVSQLKEVQEKAKETNLKKYGVENAMQSKDLKEKRKQTNLKKYGVECTLHFPEVQEKVKQTNLKKYGVEHSSQSKEIQAKVKQTKLERGLIYVTDEDFIKTVKNWKATHGRKPTLTELANHWGYSGVSDKVSQLGLSHFVNRKESYLELIIKDFLDEFGINYKRQDKTEIAPLELDFYLPNHNVAIEVNDFLTHNSSFNPWGIEPKKKNYHINKTKLCKDKGIKLIHAWEHHITDESKFKILKNLILQACGKLKEVNADNTTIEMRPATEMKNFFNENHIDGYKDAQDCYSLICNNTGETLLAYSLNVSENTAEITQYATKLDYSITDGDSKLWHHIINNTNYNSITYDVDLDMHPNNPMNFLNVKLFSEQLSKKEYWPKEGVLKDINSLNKPNKVWEIWGAGTQTYVWDRQKEKGIN